MDQDASLAFTEADSDQEMESLTFMCENEPANDEDSNEIPIASKKSRKILSDSEEEDEKEEEISNKNLVENEEKSENDEKSPKPRQKISNLIDSDSEPENNDLNESNFDDDDKKTEKQPKKSKSNDLLAELNLDFDSSSDESVAGSAKSSKNSTKSDNDDDDSGDESVPQAKGHPDAGRKQRVNLFFHVFSNFFSNICNF